MTEGPTAQDTPSEGARNCPVCDRSYPAGVERCEDCGATLIAPRIDPHLGVTLKDSYHIEAKIGQGGMGAVYRAIQQPLGRPVAVKILPASFDDEDAIKRFYREARLQSQLRHPNVAGVIDFGNTPEGLMYMVVEYLEGKPLNEYIEPGKGLPSEAQWLMGDICAGISAAHQQGLIHRDLKPANIYVSSNSDDTRMVKVLDFGLAKVVGNDDSVQLTRTGLIMGTPGYMAPEQIEDTSSADSRSDIYALGAILYYILTGHQAFGGNSVQLIMTRQLMDAPTFEYLEERGLPPALRPLLERTMAVDPSLRPASAQELFSELCEIPGLGQLGIGGGTTSSRRAIPAPTTAYSMPGPSPLPEESDQPLSEPTTRSETPLPSLSGELTEIVSEVGLEAPERRQTDRRSGNRPECAPEAPARRATPLLALVGLIGLLCLIAFVGSRFVGPADHGSGSDLATGSGSGSTPTAAGSGLGSSAAVRAAAKASASRAHRALQTFRSTYGSLEPAPPELDLAKGLIAKADALLPKDAVAAHRTFKQAIATLDLATRAARRMTDGAALLIEEQRAAAATARDELTALRLKITALTTQLGAGVPPSLAEGDRLAALAAQQLGAMVYAQASANYKLAKTQFERALRWAEDIAKARHTKALAAQTTAQSKRKQTLTQIRDSGIEPPAAISAGDALLAKGSTLLRAGKSEQARLLFDQASTRFDEGARKAAQSVGAIKRAAEEAQVRALAKRAEVARLVASPDISTPTELSRGDALAAQARAQLAAKSYTSAETLFTQVEAQYALALERAGRAHGNVFASAKAARARALARRLEVERLTASADVDEPAPLAEGDRQRAAGDQQMKAKSYGEAAKRFSRAERQYDQALISAQAVTAGLRSEVEALRRRAEASREAVAKQLSEPGSSPPASYATGDRHLAQARAELAKLSYSKAKASLSLAQASYAKAIEALSKAHSARRGQAERARDLARSAAARWEAQRKSLASAPGPEVERAAAAAGQQLTRGLALLDKAKFRASTTAFKTATRGFEAASEAAKTASANAAMSHDKALATARKSARDLLARAATLYTPTRLGTAGLDPARKALTRAHQTPATSALPQYRAAILALNTAIDKARQEIARRRRNAKAGAEGAVLRAQRRYQQTDVSPPATLSQARKQLDSASDAKTEDFAAIARYTEAKSSAEAAENAAKALIATARSEAELERAKSEAVRKAAGTRWPAAATALLGRGDALLAKERPMGARKAFAEATRVYRAEVKRQAQAAKSGATATIKRAKHLRTRIGRGVPIAPEVLAAADRSLAEAAAHFAGKRWAQASAQAQSALPALRQALVAYHAAKAREHVDRSAALEGDQREALLNLAIAEYDEVLALDDKHVDSYRGRAAAFLRTDRLKPALDDYDRAIALDNSHAKTFFNRGYIRSKRGLPEGALADYDQAIKLDPKYIKARYARGILLFNRSEFKGASADMAAVCAAEPRSWRAWFYRAQSQEKLGQSADALASYRQSLAHAPATSREMLKDQIRRLSQ